MTPPDPGCARLRFFKNGIDQSVDCGEREAHRRRREINADGGYVYRVDYGDPPLKVKDRP